MLNTESNLHLLSVMSSLSFDHLPSGNKPYSFSQIIRTQGLEYTLNSSKSKTISEMCEFHKIFPQTPLGLECIDLLETILGKYASSVSIDINLALNTWRGSFDACPEYVVYLKKPSPSNHIKNIRDLFVALLDHLRRENALTDARKANAY